MFVNEPAPSQEPAATPPAGGTPPVQEPAATPAATPAASDTPWYQGFDGLDDATTQAISKFKTPGELAKGYANAQSLIGKKFSLENWQQDDGKKAEVAKALGIPDEAAGYAAAEGVNPELWGKMAEVAKQNYVSPQALAEITKVAMEQAGADAAAQTAAYELAVKQNSATLKAEWGNDYAANRDHMMKWCADNNIDTSNPALADINIVKALWSVASQTKEGTLPQGSQFAGGVDARATVAKIYAEHGRDLSFAPEHVQSQYRAAISYLAKEAARGR